MDQVDDFKVKKTIKKLPKYIQNKFARWIESIQKDGWLFVKGIGNYRDHALKGNLKGQRSARLGWSYRIIYEVIENKGFYRIIIKGVTKHDYK